MRARRTLLFSLLVLVVAVLVFIHFRHGEPEGAGQASSVRDVSVALARTGSITQDLTVAGIFQPYQDVDVHGKVSGYIRRIYVDIGDRVHQGQTLAVLEVPELQAEVAGAEAGVTRSRQDITRMRSDVDRAQANYAATHASFTRLKQAGDQQPGLVAAQELDDARARDAAAAAQVESARAAVAAAEGQLGVSRADQLRVSSMAQYATITAPFSGVVTMRYADTGSLVPAGTSESNAQAIVRLSQSDVLRLRMPVPEQDVPLVKQGSTVNVQVQATGQQFPGTVVRFTRDVSNATRTMLCEVDVPNPNLQLTPGMYANVTFTLHQPDGALLVPSAAIIQGDQPAVFLVDNSNTVVRRPVVLGITSANEQQITGGLQAGDKVIVAGMDTLQPGERVQPQIASPNLVSYHAKGDQ